MHQTKEGFIMKLSDKLITLRKENGWSQEDFAEKLDVSRQAISRWENGTALPDAQNILQISKLFNVTADYLLNDDYNEEANISAVEISAEETKPLARKKKHLHWLSICFIILLSVCAIIYVVKISNEVHTHPEFTRVVENEIAPTCTAEGSYDVVLYCTECGKGPLYQHRSLHPSGERWSWCWSVLRSFLNRGLQDLRQY